MRIYKKEEKKDPTSIFTIFRLISKQNTLLHRPTITSE